MAAVATVAGALLPAATHPALAAAGTTVGGMRGAAEDTAEAAALAEASAGGRRVEVIGARSETRQVFANPDGTFTAEISLQPVRVRRPDGSWAPVDTTLRMRPDGTVAPAATTVDMAFSGGGKAPLARISRSGKALAMRWPGSLPAPVLAGDTATYGEVLPGVDLQVRAEAAGFAELLVVKTRAAAANPALATVRFPMDTRGLDVRADADGGLAAVDAAGGTVFRAPAPAMWDTAGDPADTAADRRGVPGAHRASLGVRVSAGALELTPDRSILTGAGTRFPVVIDPTWTYGTQAWTEVNAFDPTSTTWRTVPTSLAVGYQDFQPPTLVRSFVRFGLDTRIFGTHILSATLNTFETWSASCNARPVEVWVTGGFNSGTSWNNQPTWGSRLFTQNVAKGWSSACPAGGVEFDVTAGVAGAARNHTGLTLGLRATNEGTAANPGDPLAWKKFQVNPTLTVVYNRRPNTPTTADLSTSNPTSKCATTAASAPRVNITRNEGITLKVRASDPDGNKVKVTFDFRPNNGRPIAAPVSAAFASGTTVTVNILRNVTPPLTDNTTYAWHAYVEDVDAGGRVIDRSPVSVWCFITHDGTAPSPPEVTSTDYPPDEYTGFAGDAGTFHFAPGATRDTDIVRYHYGLDQPSTLSSVAAGADLTAAVPVIPPSYGPHDLWVRAEDRAGTFSSAIPYHFYVSSPTDAIAYWKLDEGTGTTATGTVEQDPAATGPIATLSPTGATWTTTGRSGAAVHLDGTSGYVSTTVHVTTSQSYSASAWVKLTSKAADAVALSQAPSVSGGFSLGYVASLDRWCFYVRPDGGPAETVPPPPVSDRTCSAAAPTLNVWTHLVGVRTVTSSSTGLGRSLGLYVNGVSAGSASRDLTPAAGGTVQIGRGDGPAGWPGDIDDVRVYDRWLRAGEVADLAGQASNATLTGSWSFNETTGSTAADASGKNHPATLAAGATFTPGGNTAGGLALDGVAGSASTTAPVVRTDQSFVVAAWVKLNRNDGQFTIVSQDGVDAPGFSLQYVPDDGGLWRFGLSEADAKGNPPPLPAEISAIDTVSAWVHVVGSYDAFTHVVRIQVADSFGFGVGYGVQRRPWNATGRLQVGRALMTDDDGNVGYGDYLPGVVDDVKVYSGVLVDRDLRSLAG